MHCPGFTPLRAVPGSLDRVATSPGQQQGGAESTFGRPGAVRTSRRAPTLPHPFDPICVHSSLPAGKIKETPSRGCRDGVKLVVRLAQFCRDCVDGTGCTPASCRRDRSCCPTWGRLHVLEITPVQAVWSPGFLSFGKNCGERGPQLCEYISFCDLLVDRVTSVSGLLLVVDDGSNRSPGGFGQMILPKGSFGRWIEGH